MRKIAAVSGAALVLGLGFGLANPFASATAHDGDHMVFTEKERSSSEIDLGKKDKFEQGDRFVFVNDLIDEDGDKAGTDAGDCVATEVKSDDEGTVLCTVGISLEGGTIMVGAYVPFSDDFDVAILGGTGKYAAARGVVNVVTEDGEQASTITIELVD